MYLGRKCPEMDKNLAKFLQDIAATAANAADSARSAVETAGKAAMEMK